MYYLYLCICTSAKCMSVELKVHLFIWSLNFRFSMSLSLSPNSLYRLHRRWRFNEGALYIQMIFLNALGSIIFCRPCLKLVRIITLVQLPHQYYKNTDCGRNTGSGESYKLLESCFNVIYLTSCNARFVPLILIHFMDLQLTFFF